jgi:dolichol-phosphate mannosyltransferase
MNQNVLSIVIPTYNEKENISNLIKRIDWRLSIEDIRYEIIFIDDHSTDGTENEIIKHAYRYPVKFYLKKGKKGKAHSLLEGFDKVVYPNIAIIDADLQYPPEVLPSMLHLLRKNDIVVARRNIRKTSLIRNILSRGFMTVFAKKLHGIDTDVQSGLKVFRKKF